MADNNTTAAPTAANSNQANDNNRSSSAQGFRGRGGGGARGNRGGRGGSNRAQRGRGGGRNNGPNSKGADRKKDMGRQDYQRNIIDRRERIDETRASKRQKTENGEAKDAPFSREEIEAEARKPKRKVAVMIGYAGTGYKGMQINSQEKTIEGDIFKAFVAAGAISKANADDPKKSSLVRCARTDKGVHAAGNVISLKLIVEDPNTVQNINEHLPPQIRVWGIERTNGSFSCYQTCDSRWYEYLIPTYSFLPPHPQSYLGKELVQAAEREGVYESYRARQEDVATFWEEAEKKYIEPILEKLDPDMRAAVMAEIIKGQDINVEKTEKKVIKSESGASIVDKATEDTTVKNEMDGIKSESGKDSSFSKSETDQLKREDHQGGVEVKKEKIEETEEESPVIKSEADQIKREDHQEGVEVKKEKIEQAKENSVPESDVNTVTPINGDTDAVGAARVDGPADDVVKEENVLKNEVDETKSILTPLEAAIKEVKGAIITAKKAYRISASRQKAVQDALNIYLGTRNFHNYTIQKTYSDPSAKRVIRSFKVHPEPIIINDTEWLSVKVHGQSFMMHQIRKMVAMVALVVRCGSATSIINDSYGPANISIPKAPSLGLLLERPVFETYNEKATKEYSREKLDFDKYKTEMDEFKQREIYDRIFREEERDHQFHIFFNHIDHFRSDYFLWVTASGVSAAKQSKAAARNEDGSDDEADANGEEG